MMNSGTNESEMLKTIVEEELYRYEARYGKVVCHRATPVFIMKILKLIIFMLVIIAFFIPFIAVAMKLIISSMGMSLLILGIIFSGIKGVNTEISFKGLIGSMNPVVHYVMTLAKKNPDRKIRDIIYTVCDNTQGRGSDIYQNDPPSDYQNLVFIKGMTNKTQERISRVLMGMLGIFIVCGFLGVAGYYLIPCASYVSVGNGYMLNNYRMGFSLEGKAVIPDTYNGEPVVAINAGAFKGDLFLKTVELPDTIQTIGGEAFMNCRRLQNINIPEGVSELRGNTFEGCSLEYVTVPDSVVEIHGECFLNCKKLQLIKLSSQITEIKGSTFEGCSSLLSIDIPEGVTRIGGHAFYGCRSLSVVNEPLTVESIGSSAFRNCRSLNQITLPPNALVNERAFKDSPTTISYYESMGR